MSVSGDKRNLYRAVSFMDTYGERWKVQFKVWWWPFWRTITSYAHDLETAHKAAVSHASRPTFVRRVVVFGRLP